jgi:hypothetical protein
MLQNDFSGLLWARTHLPIWDKEAMFKSLSGHDNEFNLILRIVLNLPIDGVLPISEVA